MNNAPNRPHNPAKPTDKTQNQRPAADRDSKDRDQKGRDQKDQDQKTRAQKGDQPGRKSTTSGKDQDRNVGNKMPGAADEKAAREREDTTDAGATENVSGRKAKSGAPIELEDDADSVAQQHTPRKGDGPSEEDARKHKQASHDAAEALEKASEKKESKKS